MEFYLFITSFFIYFSRSVFFLLGSKKGRLNINSLNLENYPSISIVVPAKNEENNIEECIRAIMKSNYPSDKFELIVVNDQSTDNTKQKIDYLVTEFPNLKPIHVPLNFKKEILGKPGALEIGIEKSENEIILFTDADCIVNKNWISSMARTFVHKKSDLVASFTLVKYNKFFGKFQAVEWLMSHTMASGGIGFGFTLGCFGNNMAITKNMYNKLGGYKKIPFSVTEDLALLQAVDKEGGRLNYICAEESTVKTMPIDTVINYLKQRKRWALGGRSLGWKAVFFVITSLLIWISAIVSLAVGNLFLASMIIAIKVVSDLILILPSVLTVKEYRLIPYIIPSSIIFLLVELLLPILILDKKVEWKGNTFDL